MDSRPSYTGRKRRHKTALSVRLGEILSRLIIKFCGIGTILAVGTVCVFLVVVAVPLFLPARVSAPETYPAPSKPEIPIRTGVDEYQAIRWSLFQDGTVGVFGLENGQFLHRSRPEKFYTARPLTACSAPSRSDELALGFRDGTVQLGRVAFRTRTLDAAEITEPLKQLTVGASAPFQGGLVRYQADGHWRVHSVTLEMEDPIKAKSASAVLRIDQSIRANGPVVSVLAADGKLRTSSVVKREDLLEDKVYLELSGGEMQVPVRPETGPPNYLLVSGVGDNVFLAWNDGHILRISTLNLEHPTVAEELNLLDQPGQKLTALQFMIGKATLLAGDSTGRVRAWFLARDAKATAPDGQTLVMAHELPGPNSAVTSLAVSSRTRLMAAGYADGRVRLFYVTSEKRLGEVMTRSDQPVVGLALAPKENGLLARTDSDLWYWTINPGYPEITLRSLFRPVWYEGYDQPEHVWQTSGGDDAVEPKFGMWPLVFGTIKATFYSLLLAVPLALLAAIYTSEFLHPRTRAVIKPTIEMMASLPSVVLGFLGAMVVAPFVEHRLSAVLVAFFTIPGAFLLGAYLWQLLPEKVSLRWARWRFFYGCLVLPVGIAAAAAIGPSMDRMLFAGNLRGWIDSGSGPSTPGWFVLFIPFCGLATLFLLLRWVNPWFRRRVAVLSRFQTALADLGKFVVAVLFALGLAWVLAVLLAWVGFDPRGPFVGTYVQRNALVVGFMMGFAIIPIIYTIGEDALSLVPAHLRSASLGCGATPWQTAVRIVIPTAMSGLFSALMVGLGRAVGETMIVLMAAGNTPILEWNIFNGFRTLSANIATEMPEAVRDSTHYRTLFLAALLLFMLTFVLNTVAEVVRQRFRKRAYQL